MALRTQRYVCDRCGYRWEQLIWDGGRPETECLFCRQPTAMPVLGDALDALPGPDGLSWSDEWRGSPALELATATVAQAPRRPRLPPPASRAHVVIVTPGPGDQAGPLGPKGEPHGA